MALTLVPASIPEEALRRLRDLAVETCGSQTSQRAFGATYGAAVLTASGATYCGRNCFSSSLSGSVHAEQAALIHAYAHDDMEVWAIAIASGDDSCEPVPCSLCRQLLFENGRHTGIDIFVQTVSGASFASYPLSVLYPRPWPECPPRHG